MQLKGTYKEILQIAFPIILGSFAQSINQFIDMVFMGRVGIVEMGATNIGGLLYFLIVIIGMGFTKGGQILIAKKTGEDDPKGVGNLFWHLLLILLIYFSITFTASLFGSKSLLSIILQSPQTIENSNIYYQSRIYGLLFCLLSAGFNGFFSGIGKTFIISASTIIMVLVNIFLDYAMIFGNFGFEKMGIQGAGLATSIAEMVGFLVFVSYLIYKKYIKTYNILPLPTFKLNTLKTMFELSIPLCFQYAFGLGSWLIFFLLIEKMGESALAISSVLKSIYIFVGIPAWSLASTANTVVANIWGQGKIELISKALWRVVKVSFLLSFVFILGLILFPTQVLAFYLPNNTDLLKDSISSLYVITIALTIMSFSTILLHGIMGLGKTKFSFIVEVCCAVFYLFFVVITVNVLSCPLYIVWMAEIIYWLIMLIFCIYFLKFTNWKNDLIYGDEKLVSDVV
ncbi:MAG: MATE family efflux transporter [Bacteroidetes bacterium]|nr:MATE family efflux transporter [Bacteroidota bacterium]